MMRIIVSVLIAMQLAACAPIYEQRYDYRDGWRKGRVVQITTRAALKLHPDSDCTRDAGDSEPVALVSHHGAGSPISYHAVPLPKSANIDAGDFIYVNVERCEVAIVRRSEN